MFPGSFIWSITDLMAMKGDITHWCSFWNQLRLRYTKTQCKRLLSIMWENRLVITRRYFAALIQVLCHFICICRACKEMLSDNSTSFVEAQTEIRLAIQQLHQEVIQRALLGKCHQVLATCLDTVKTILRHLHALFTRETLKDCVC